MRDEAETRLNSRTKRVAARTNVSATFLVRSGCSAISACSARFRSGFFKMWHAPHSLSRESEVVSLEQEKSGSRLLSPASRLQIVACATFLFALLTPLALTGNSEQFGLSGSAIPESKF